MKHPPHLYTIVTDFGPDIAPFQQHHADLGRARRVLALLRDRMHHTQGRCIERVEMWHKGTMIVSYTFNTPTVWLPPPDADGITRIPERHSRYKPIKASCLAEYERFGKPSEMAGKVRKGAKRLPATITDEELALISL